MDDERFNGWTNRETWTVSLWLDNDEGSYRYWRDQARHYRERMNTIGEGKFGPWTPREAERILLSNQLRQEIKDSMPLQDPGMYGDLLNTALAAVNWMEIAEAMLSEIEDDRAEMVDQEPEVNGEVQGWIRLRLVWLLLGWMVVLGAVTLFFLPEIVCCSVGGEFCSGPGLIFECSEKRGLQREHT